MTDGALTVSPSRSSLHQSVTARLLVRLEAVAPEPLGVTQAVEIRLAVAKALPRWAGRGEGPTVPEQGS